MRGTGGYPMFEALVAKMSNALASAGTGDSSRSTAP